MKKFFRNREKQLIIKEKNICIEEFWVFIDSETKTETDTFRKLLDSRKVLQFLN